MDDFDLEGFVDMATSHPVLVLALVLSVAAQGYAASADPDPDTRDPIGLFFGGCGVGCIAMIWLDPGAGPIYILPALIFAAACLTMFRGDLPKVLKQALPGGSLSEREGMTRGEAQLAQKEGYVPSWLGFAIMLGFLAAVVLYALSVV